MSQFSADDLAAIGQAVAAALQSVLPGAIASAIQASNKSTLTGPPMSSPSATAQPNQGPPAPAKLPPNPAPPPPMVYYCTASQANDMLKMAVAQGVIPSATAKVVTQDQAQSDPSLLLYGLPAQGPNGTALYVIEWTEPDPNNPNRTRICASEAGPLVYRYLELLPTVMNDAARNGGVYAYPKIRRSGDGSDLEIS